MLPQNQVVTSLIIYFIICPFYVVNFWLQDSKQRLIEDDEIQFECSKDTFEDDSIFNYDESHFNRTISSKISIGGQYINRNCDYTDFVAIIVPYRNRAQHLEYFLKYIHSFLITQNEISYRIFVVEQHDNQLFNRGMLMNIGFRESLKFQAQISCFIFHDVDILPIDLRHIYRCSNRPRHFCSYLESHRYVLLYESYFGGVVGLNRRQFQYINGFSNQFFGWGGEDDDLLFRFKPTVKIERYDKEIGKCKTLRHSHNVNESSNRFELLKTARKRSYQDGLSTINDVASDVHYEYYPFYTKIITRVKM